MDYLIMFAILSFLLGKNHPLVYRLLDSHVIRNDSGGSGFYGASRVGHTHKGVDLLVKEGEPIKAPFNGKFIRQASPYAKDSRFNGGLISNNKGFEFKIFYFKPLLNNGQSFKKGDTIGYAQAISDKYPKVKNHIHIEAYKNGHQIDPTKYLI